MAKREKTISYRRAEWFIPATGKNLESLLRQVGKKLPDILERTVAHGDHLARTIKQKEHHAGGILVHLTVETPGESASVVPHAAPKASEVDLKTEKPPADGEWLDGDAFLYVRSDHLCMCTTGLHDGAIRFILHELMQKAKLGKDATAFELMKVADMGKVQMLHAQGVAELEIRGTLYKATADYHKRKGEPQGGLGAIGKYFKLLLQREHDVTPDGLRVIIGLKVDKRFSKQISVGYKTIETLAAQTVNKHNDKDYDYVIVTKTGQRITPDEIFMRTTVEIEADGKTVQREKAWKELVRFYDSLRESGALAGASK
ncbi:MAG: hypothetical protein L0210_07740 [Rhodospirillales bacterium]|nr:hypothetical protein [Rhodospirillales bacterium]